MAAKDDFRPGGARAGAATGPARKHITTVISDTQTLAYVTRAIRCNAAGDVCLVFADDPADATGEVYSVVAGERLDVSARQIMETGTTLAASDIKCWG